MNVNGCKPLATMATGGLFEPKALRSRSSTSADLREDFMSIQEGKKATMENKLKKASANCYAELTHLRKISNY